MLMITYYVYVHMYVTNIFWFFLAIRGVNRNSGPNSHTTITTIRTSNSSSQCWAFSISLGYQIYYRLSQKLQRVLLPSKRDRIRAGISTVPGADWIFRWKQFPAENTIRKLVSSGIKIPWCVVLQNQFHPRGLQRVFRLCTQLRFKLIITRSLIAYYLCVWVGV